MNIDRLCNLVISKFIQSGGYSEVPIDDLRVSIHKHLSAHYERKVKYGNTMLDIRKARGERIGIQHYSEATQKAESNTIMCAYAISAGSWADLKHIGELSKL